MERHQGMHGRRVISTAREIAPIAVRRAVDDWPNRQPDTLLGIPYRQ